MFVKPQKNKAKATKEVRVQVQPKVLAIDFDGVIHDYRHPVPGRKMGAPIPGAKESLQELKDRGFRLIVHCYWAGTEQGRKTIADFMAYYQLPFDEITNIKPNAQAYIDDKALRFRGDWEEIKRMV